MANASFGHDGDSDRALDLFDEMGVGHSGDTTLGSDIGRNALQGHDGVSTILLGDAGLGRVDNVYDDATAEHLG
ncbi:hypothetical protein TB2_028823 [Malus domestica]